MFEHDRITVAQREAALDLPFDDAITEALLIFCQNAPGLFGFGVDDGEGVAFQFRAVQAHQFAERLVDRHDEAVFVGQPHAVHRIFPHRMEQHLGTAQRGFGVLALADVAHVEQHGGLVSILDARSVNFHRCHPAVRGSTLAFHARRLPVHQFPEIPRDLPPFFRRHQI